MAIIALPILRPLYGFASPTALAEFSEEMLERQSIGGQHLAIGFDGIRVKVFPRELERSLDEFFSTLPQRHASGRTAYHFGPLARWGHEHPDHGRRVERGPVVVPVGAQRERLWVSEVDQLGRAFSAATYRTT